MRPPGVKRCGFPFGLARTCHRRDEEFHFIWTAHRASSFARQRKRGSAQRYGRLEQRARRAACVRAESARARSGIGRLGSDLRQDSILLRLMGQPGLRAVAIYNRPGSAPKRRFQNTRTQSCPPPLLTTAGPVVQIFGDSAGGGENSVSGGAFRTGAATNGVQRDSPDFIALR